MRAGVHADGEVERPLGEAHLQDVSRDPHLPREFLQNSKSKPDSDSRFLTLFLILVLSFGDRNR